MTIVFDNYNYNHQELRSLWGFSLYIEEEGLLFDTGSNGRVLLKNLSALNIDVSTIKYLFISHAHWDHIGGLDSILELNPNITLFVPRSLSKHLIDDLKTLTKEVVVISKPQKLFKNFYSTGLLGKEIPEQSLIIDGDMPMLISGCGHFGVENIVKKASLQLHKKIKSCIGGFHLINKSHEEIEASIIALKTMGIVQVCPTHCSGDDSITMFQEYFKSGYIQGGVGAKI